MSKSVKRLAIVFALILFSARAGFAETTGIETLGDARFTVITPQLIRMEYAPDGKFVDAPSWFAMNRDARFTVYQVQREAGSLTIETGAIKLVYLNDGKPFDQGNLHAEIKKGNGTVTWQFGMQATGNLGGSERTLDGARQAFHIGDGILSRDGWSPLDDSKSVLATKDWFEERPKNGSLDWYLFGYGLDYKAALKSLTTISGSIPLPRKYTMGLWYSRYWPYSADDFKQIVNEYHQHDFPLDVLVIDMDWHTDGWTGYTWNPKLIPDGPGLLNWLHQQGLAVTLNDHPADGVQPKESMYADFMKAMGQDLASGQTLPFDAGDKKYLDTFYQYTHEPLVKEGVDFWWLDWQQYYDAKSLPDVTNLSMLNDYYFKKMASDGKRGQSFSRWAYWGDQRNPIHFSGDADTGWKMLAFEVPFTSTSGNVGCFFWTHDIGGHMGGRNEESYTRWCQFGALSAALRSHSTRNAEMDRRPWTYPAWAEKSMQVSFHLRAKLLPYIYSCARDATKSSVPMIRPMYIDHPDREEAYHNGQEYYLGDNLLVAPIAMPGVGPNRVAWQHVWFPEGTWFQFFTGEKYDGPAGVVAAADINEFPLFVRGGVPLPEQPYVERPATAPLTHLVVRCFPGADGKTGTSTLYEDDGISDEYMKGGFATTALSYARDGNKVTVKIAPAQGSYKGQPAKRSYTILLPTTQKGTLVAPTNAQLTYDAATATNQVEIPETDIGTGIELTVTADEADAGQIRQSEVARRLNGLLGKPLEDWVKTDRATATPETLEAVNAVQGAGIMAVNQHPYLLGNDVRLVYFNSALDKPTQGTISYGSWSKDETLTPGQPIDLSGLESTIPPADVVEVPGASKRLKVVLENGKLTLSADVAPLIGILGDLALSAAATASSGDASALNDGSAEGFPGSQRWEWIPDHNGVKPDWAQLTWPAWPPDPIKVKRVLLYDRPNLNDQVLAGKLTFSDGTSQDVGPLPNDGKTPLEVVFPEKKIKWVKFEITQSGPKTENIGLSEIAVFDR
jgi:alpha-glucosidase (family GH31 glycosyl hydrolase)